MSIFKGLAGPVIYRDEFEFSPDTGRRRIIEYHGRKIEIQGMMANLERDGTSYRIFKKDDVYYGLVATWQDAVPSVDNEGIRWGLRSETNQQSLFKDPQIAAEIEGYSNPNALKKAIQEAVEQGKTTITDNFSSDTTIANPVTFDSATYPWSYKVMEELRRGVDHYDNEFLVLHRDAIRSARYVSTRMTLELTQKIYATDQLGLPANIAFIIPDYTDLIPLAPGNTYWGWRLRGVQSEFEGESIRQTHEFVLANWSTNLYSRATSNFAYQT